MHKIWGHLETHFKADFQWHLYLSIVLFLSLLIGINYQINLEKGIIDAYRGSILRIVWYFLLYALAYYGSLLLWVGFNKKWHLLQNPKVWLYSLFILSVLAVDGGFYGYHNWSLTIFDGQIYTYAFRCFSNLSSALTVFLPLGLFYYFLDTQRHYFYGFEPKSKSVTPYLKLLIFMVPLIVWASFQPDFLASYPSYRNSNADEFLGVPNWATALFYELCYTFDFVSTELVFRGFMIVGMAHLLGRGAVLPMVVCYATLHFGKPLGETIGSIAGGYVLGVLALYSRSIWGGIVIHIGVAWLMDLAAWSQSLF
jgi:hypothetical protein